MSMATSFKETYELACIDAILFYKYMYICIIYIYNLDILYEALQDIGPIAVTALKRLRVFLQNCGLPCAVLYLY